MRTECAGLGPEVVGGVALVLDHGLTCRHCRVCDVIRHVCKQQRYIIQGGVSHHKWHVKRHHVRTCCTEERGREAAVGAACRGTAHKLLLVKQWLSCV